MEVWVATAVTKITPMITLHHPSQQQSGHERYSTPAAGWRPRPPFGTLAKEHRWHHYKACHVARARWENLRSPAQPR